MASKSKQEGKGDEIDGNPSYIEPRQGLVGVNRLFSGSFRPMNLTVLMPHSISPSPLISTH